MSKKSNQKLKLLYIIKILREKTDEDHPISTGELISELEKCGISAERKSVYDDIEALMLFGLDIVKIQAKSNLYYLGERELQLPELKLLVDAVQSAKFITYKKSLELISKLEKIAGEHSAKQLRRQISVSKRVKTSNEKIYYAVDAIHLAIWNGRKILFKYFEWTADKKMQLKNGGEDYEVSPLGLTWADENYYLVAHSEKRGKLLHFRVDKITDIRESEEKIPPNFRSFDMAEYTKKIFGMYGGEEENVCLRLTSDLAGVIFDRFGDGVSMIKEDENHFTVRLNVSISPVFISWLMGFGAKAEVISPQKLIDEIKGFSRDILNLYK